jgi:exodeoxyribonuclease VII large subunit
MTSNDLMSLDITVHNQPPFTVSELANALKRTVEGAFAHVRVRGEITGYKRHSSGHLYLDIKDDHAVINAVCWKGVAAKMAFTPENGLEVICTGRMTTYAGRSNYQLIIERMEIAGEGALMALLEKRRQQLASEGLFDADRKLPIPYLPRVIGVVTSPTGAVIRDILHRLQDRFPVHVLIWGVAVQGKGAEVNIAAAIEGFQQFDGVNSPPRPDLLIVARGGGSLEDLWCFNEEIVVRAVAASIIPIISAVGHETDTTLIDYAASMRAPTPTAAAEMAVPVLMDLLFTVQQYGQRLHHIMMRRVTHEEQHLTAIARGIISPEKTLEARIQRADEWSERLQLTVMQLFQQQSRLLAMYEQRLQPQIIQHMLKIRAERAEMLGSRVRSSILMQR